MNTPLNTLPKTARRTLSLSLLATPLLQAHPGHSQMSLWNGLHHPVSGLDHILAMVAVGLWAAQIGGRALWMIPTSFVSMMAFGFLFGIRGIEIPMTEQGILASVFILGLLIATATRLPLLWGSLIVSLFALCHGFVHGAEMPLNASGIPYALGFMGATALLHGWGIGIAFGLRKVLSEPMLRFAGIAVVFGGIYLSL